MTEGEHYVVAIGASAGGLEALEHFFDAMPADAGFSYIIVQHLSPVHASQMDELLRRRTRIPVSVAEDGARVEPNHIYLGVPGKQLGLQGGRLVLRDRVDGPLNHPIDAMFRELAAEVGGRAVGVVLSGTGTDGSRGIRAIHEAGGLVLGQDDATAKFDGMPRSARASGVVDVVLPPGEMPAVLTSYAERAGTPVDPKAAPSMDRLRILLKEHHKLDLESYKPNTVARRLERRIGLARADSLEAYIERLEDDPDELEALRRDLLINVTQFFRDTEGFNRLESEVLRPLVENRPSREEIRVWVAGCATGEEAYSIAMLLTELSESMGKAPNFRLFATDVSQDALTVASRGVYGPDSIGDLSPTRIARFFRRDGASFTVDTQLRERVVFAPHDLLEDSPFTRMDLVTCRNLLIYLQPEAQKLVLLRLLFSLRKDGHLFLGPSETPASIHSAVEPLDKSWRIFRKLKSLPARPGTTSASLPSRSADSGAPPAHRMLPIYDSLLERYMPPSLLVDRDFRLLHSFSGAQDFLRLAGGRPTTAVLDLVTPKLKAPLSGALRHAHQSRTGVRYANLHVDLEGRAAKVSLQVEPIRTSAETPLAFLVVIERSDVPDVEERQPVPPPIEASAPSEYAHDYVEGLENELTTARENLQATVEELESSNEELQASNEELVASNEELQSTNEELHSVNEELYTVNAEHQRKIQELTEVTNDLNNLLDNLDVGVLFVDDAMRVRRVTRDCAKLFRMLPRDVGRDFGDFAGNAGLASLLERIQSCIDSGEHQELSIEDRDGRHRLLRVHPYQEEGAARGAMLTLIDITSLKRAQARVEQLSDLVKSSEDAILALDLDGRLTSMNQSAATLFDLDADDLADAPAPDILPRGAVPGLPRRLQRLRRGGYESFVGSHRPSDDPAIDLSWTLSPILDGSEATVGFSLIGRNITRLKEAERRVREAVEQRDRFIAILSHELRNPLATVLNAVRMLGEAGVDASLQKRARSIIERQSQHIARLLDDMLDVSRMRHDRFEMRMQDLDLRTPIRGALEAMHSLSEDKGITLAADLPQGPVPIHGDASRLQQLASNLLSNAVRYSPAGSSVRIALTARDGFAELRVEDAGRGIPPSELSSIFEPFAQVDDAGSPGREGLGLGLALVDAITKAHGGSVEAHSDGPGAGAEFVARLPVDSMELAAAERPAPEKRDTNLRILLAEDEPDSREMLGMLMERRGYTVCTAADGAEALEQFERDPPDVAVLDISMPKLDGIATAKQIREQYGDGVLLIALTGYGQQSDRERIMAAGFDRHLVKPIETDVLWEALERHDG